MVRSALGKVMWVGRATVFLVGLAVILGLVFGAVSQAVAHSNVDTKLFHLSHGNIVGTATSPAKTPTSLISTLDDALKSALIVNNKSGGPALDLRVGNATIPADRVAPLKVNSSGLVANLNADKVDGLTSEELRGQQGEPGPQGPQGPKGVEWRGDWSNVQSYTPGDAVSYQGESYIATTQVPACTSICQIRPSDSQWDLLAQSGATGPQGPQGATGPQGPQGVPGISGYEVIYAQGEVPHGDGRGVKAMCPSGKKVIGGGGNGGGLHLIQSAPIKVSSLSYNAWYVRPEINNAGETRTVTAYVICANVN